MVSERSLANLKPFVKGDPRRAKGGRPKGVSLLTLLQHELDKPCVEGSKVTKRQMFVARCVDLALAGNPLLIKLIWEYAEGKPDQRLEVEFYETVRIESERRGVDPDRVISFYESLKKRRAV